MKTLLSFSLSAFLFVSSAAPVSAAWIAADPVRIQVKSAANLSTIRQLSGKRPSARTIRHAARSARVR